MKNHDSAVKGKELGGAAYGLVSAERGALAMRTDGIYVTHGTHVISRGGSFFEKTFHPRGHNLSTSSTSAETFEVEVDHEAIPRCPPGS